MNNNSKRLYRYIAKQHKLILWGVLATLLMSLVELFTGSMLKFLINLIDKFSGSFTDGIVKNAKLPVKFAIKHPITSEKIKIFNTTLKGTDEIFSGMIQLCLIFVGLYFLLALFNYLRRTFMNIATQKILKDFKADIYKKIVRLPFGFFHRNKTGDIVSRITYDVNTLNEIIDLLIEVARAGIYILVFIPVMFLMSWELSLFTILYFPLSIILIHFITKKIKTVSKEITDNVGDYTAYLEEKINRIRLVKGHQNEAKEVHLFNNLISDNLKQNIKLVKLKFALNPGSEFLGMLILSVVYIFYSYKLTQGGGTLGDIVFFLYLVRTAYKPVKKVAQAWGQLHVALVSTRKIFVLLDEAEEGEDSMSEPHDTTAETHPIKTLSFQNVSFSYPDDTREVIQNFSFTAEKGDIIGVVGKTGSGKTTLLTLLPQFFKPTEGQILINRQALNTTQARNIICYLGSDSMMLNGSIQDNIEYSGNQIPKAKQSEFAQFIGLKNESELSWVIGKDGVNLSDGQKQKVAFLRAIISHAKVLVLDEVFASLDKADVEYIIEICKQQIDVLFIVSRKDSVLNYTNKQIRL